MKSRQNSAAGFCRSLNWSINISWFDRKGIHQIDDVRRAEITLSTLGTQDHYECFTVKIISKTHGEITNHTFRFSEYLDPNKRIDDRQHDVKPGDCYSNYEVIANTGWGWYIAIPADVTPLTNAVRDFINEYR